MNRRILTILVFCISASVFGNPTGSGAAKWDKAIQNYAQGDFLSALSAFVGFLSDPSITDKGSTFLWLSKTYLLLDDVRNATNNLEHFLTNFSGHPLVHEGNYLKARILFVQQDYEAAIKAFSSYISQYPSSDQIPNALFWMAESTYSLGLLDESKSLYMRIVTGYPTSFKVDASQYRLGLIEIKSRENELMKLLKWSHEESINNTDEFERREKAFLQAIQAYQKKIATLESGDSGGRIGQLEKQLREKEAEVNRLKSSGSSAGAASTSASLPLSGTEEQARLLNLKAQALNLKEIYLNWMVQNAQK